MPQPLPLQIGDVVRADFRTSSACDAENSRIQRVFGFQFRYQPARLAIALSLRDASMPEPAPDLSGKPIKGDTLFGQDEADLTLWIALVVQHSGLQGLSRKDFQDIVGAHWERGMGILARRAPDAPRTIEVALASLV